MKNLAKVMFGVAAAAAVTASAAGQFPFPQNMKYPHGHIIEYADTDMIKEHYKLWKQARMFSRIFIRLGLATALVPMAV